MSDGTLAARIAKAVYQIDLDELERIGPRDIARLADQWREILGRLDSDAEPQRCRDGLAAFLERTQGFSPEQAGTAAEALLPSP